MTTLDLNAVALCHEIDDAPDTDVPSLLGVLADWYEDAGDPLAAGLRLVGGRRPTAESASGQTCSWCSVQSWAVGTDLVEEETRRLMSLIHAARTSYSPRHDGARVFFDSRSAAYLALASALAGDKS